jgi:hypothetical protein
MGRDRALILHTCSLYPMYSSNEAYETHDALEERIHLALDAGLDGVELSNGPSLLTWQPTKETLKRLEGKVVTIHAEIYHRLGIGLKEWLEGILALPLQIANATFHPDELDPHELTQLSAIPLPVAIENMDKRRPTDLCFPIGVKRLVGKGVGLTYDTAHSEEHGLNWQNYEPLFAPIISETHLSIPNDGYYGEVQTGHALTMFRPGAFPVVPSSSPIVCLEGLVTGVDMLKEEVDFARKMLDA